MVKNLKQLFDEYIRDCKYSTRLRSETIRGYNEAFRHFSKLMPEVTTPKQLTVENMTEFFKRLQVRKRIVGVNTEKTGVKESTIATYRSKLNSFFESLEKKDIAENPLSKIKAPKPVYNDHRALRKNEIEKIISAVHLNSRDSLILKRDEVIIYLLLFCGLRRGEMTGLKVFDVDMDRRVLTVRGETSKSKTTRFLPINPSLFLHLEEYLRERRNRFYQTEYLVVSSTEDKGLTQHGFKHWVNKLKSLSGVNFHLHRFRHTFATNLARQGVGTFELQKLMGHTDLRMTDRYVRSLNVDDLRNSINKIDLANLI